jgi:hypothetical protein
MTIIEIVIIKIYTIFLTFNNISSNIEFMSKVTDCKSATAKYTCYQLSRIYNPRPFSVVFNVSWKINFMSKVTDCKSATTNFLDSCRGFITVTVSVVYNISSNIDFISKVTD